MSLSKSSNAPQRKLHSSAPFRTLSLDPGGTTGWATAEYIGVEPLTSFEQLTFVSGQVGPNVHHYDLWLLLQSFANYYPKLLQKSIVCESFEFRQHVGSEDDNYKRKVELISREYIGIVRLFCAIHGIPLTMNTASTGKVFVTEEKVKLLGLWTPGSTHANDAKRHLIRYLTINKRMQFIMHKWL